MKYLNNRFQENTARFIFQFKMEDFSSSDKTETVAEKTEDKEAPAAVKEKKLQRKRSASNASEGSRREGSHSPKKNYRTLNKECGLDDGVISAEDKIALFDKANNPNLFQERSKPNLFNVIKQENFPSITEVDNTIDQAEYKDFISSFSNRIDKIAATLEKE